MVCPVTVPRTFIGTEFWEMNLPSTKAQGVGAPCYCVRCVYKDQVLTDEQPGEAGLSLWP